MAFWLYNVFFRREKQNLQKNNFSAARFCDIINTIYHGKGVRFFHGVHSRPQKKPFHEWKEMDMTKTTQNIMVNIRGSQADEYDDNTMELYTEGMLTHDGGKYHRIRRKRNLGYGKYADIPYGGGRPRTAQKDEARWKRNSCF